MSGSAKLTLMQGIIPLALVAYGLEKVTLPPLMLPVAPDDDPTKELVFWGINYYVYSTVAHLRTVLRGLVQLAQVGNIPTTFFVCRNVFEWTAHACYVSRNLANYVAKNDWRRAWKLLSIAAMGNKWVKDHGPKYEPTAVLDGVPDPLRVANVIAAYEEYQRQQFGEGDAKDSYGLLSEYPHPNSLCMEQYHQYDGRVVQFVPPSTGSPLPVVNWCLIDLMTFLNDLLGISQEQSVRPQVVSVLKEIAKLAPAKRTQGGRLA